MGNFFLDCLLNIQKQLMAKLELQGSASNLSPRDKSILNIISTYPGIKTGEISKRTGLPISSVKRIITDFLESGLIERNGTGPGTNYRIT